MSASCVWLSESLVSLSFSRQISAASNRRKSEASRKIVEVHTKRSTFLRIHEKLKSPKTTYDVTTSCCSNVTRVGDSSTKWRPTAHQATPRLHTGVNAQKNGGFTFLRRRNENREHCINCNSWNIQSKRFKGDTWTRSFLSECFWSINCLLLV